MPPPNSNNAGKWFTFRVTQAVNPNPREADVPRKVGERYECEKRGAQLVYEKACPCPEGMKHSEIFCGQQMKQVSQPAT